MAELYTTPDMNVSLYDEADVLTASGESYDDGVYGEHNTENMGEVDEFV